jgi:hypothetical protein
MFFCITGAFLLSGRRRSCVFPEGPISDCAQPTELQRALRMLCRFDESTENEGPVSETQTCLYDEPAQHDLVARVAFAFVVIHAESAPDASLDKLLKPPYLTIDWRRLPTSEIGGPSHRMRS